MIAQNERSVQGKLANKTKHRTGRILAQIKQWCLYDDFIPDSRREAHLTSLCNYVTASRS